MSVDVSDAIQFLRENHRGVLITMRRDGRPQTSPVVAGVDDEGRVMISTRAPAMKVRNLRRDPRVALTALPDSFFGDWVQVEGEAEIVELPEAMELLVDLYRQIGGEHDDWDEYRRSMEREQRVIVRFAVDRAGPNASG